MSDVKHLKEVWAALLPDVAAPVDRQWALWSLLHDEEVVSKGIAQLAAKYRKLHGTMDSDHMIRFASSVMNRIDRERTNTISV